MAMTVLAASLPFPRPKRERLPLRGAILSFGIHAMVALILVAMAYFVAPIEERPASVERAVEVVMVPATPEAPAPEAFEPPPDAMPLPVPPPPNLDASAPLAASTVLPRAAEPRAAVRADTAESEAVSPLPAATAEASANRSDEAPIPQEQAEESPQYDDSSAEVVIAQAPRAVQPRNPAPQRPAPRPDTGPRGELREIDLFGSGRLGARQVAATRGGAPQDQARDASRSDSDFILAQILRRWRINFHDERYREVTFAPGNLLLRADGTLASPYSKNDPWNPYDMMGGYRQLTLRGREDHRRAVDAFLVALREAQPFQLPPTPGPYPRRIRISFRTGDL